MLLLLLCCRFLFYAKKNKKGLPSTNQYWPQTIKSLLRLTVTSKLQLTVALSKSRIVTKSGLEMPKNHKINAKAILKLLSVSLNVCCTCFSPCLCKWILIIRAFLQLSRAFKQYMFLLDLTRAVKTIFKVKNIWKHELELVTL